MMRRFGSEPKRGRDDSKAGEELSQSKPRQEGFFSHGTQAGRASVLQSGARVDSIHPFEEAGLWPTAYPPPASREDGVTFLETTAGRWCFNPNITQRMVRHREYPLLWERFQAVHNEPKGETPWGLLVMGHPGIGKTLLLDVLLSWCLYTYPTTPVVAIDISGVSLFTNHGSPKRFNAVEITGTVGWLPKLIMRLAYGKAEQDDKARLIVLHDVRSPKSFPYQGQLMSHLYENFHVTCVLASSCERENYKDFEKDTFVRRFILPALSFKEAKAFSKHTIPGLTDEAFELYFDSVGGVPRHLRNVDSVTGAVSDQNQAVRSIVFSPGLEPKMHSKISNTDMVVVPLPDEDRRMIIAFDFVSAGVRRKWFDVQDAESISEQLRRLREMRTDDPMRVVLGRIFENQILLLPSMQVTNEPGNDLSG